MIHFLCDVCGTAFDAPHRRMHKENCGEFKMVTYEDVCPICGECYFTPADLCACGRPKQKDHILCLTCRRALLGKLMDFADTLTEEEENQLDDWLDGNSIKDRRTWM